MVCLFYQKVSMNVFLRFFFFLKWENYLKLQAIVKQQDLHLITFLCFFHLNRNVFIVMNLYCFCAVTFETSGYYYNSTGLLACEPFFSKPSYRILASCAFYFPTTMVLMYCYGSSFHANRFRLASTASSTFTTPAAITEKVNWLYLPIALQKKSWNLSV